MELKLAVDMSRHYRNGNIMYIFKDIPYWFVASGETDDLMSKLEEGISEERIINSMDFSTKTFVEELIQCGIVSKDKQIQGALERYSPQKRIGKVYDVAEFELTLGCNLRCKHCYISAGVSNRDNLTLREIEDTLDDLYEINKEDIRGKRIVLTGGEPFQRKDLLSIVDSIRKRKFTTMINSNGLLIENDQMNYFSNSEDVQICVSLDGTQESHEEIRGKGTYYPTLEKIKELSKRGVPVAINMLCHQGNYKELGSLIEDTKDINLQGINPVPVVLMGRAKENHLDSVPEKELYQEIFKIIKESPSSISRFNKVSLLNFMTALAVNVKSNYCGTGTRGTYFISNIGEVYPCPNMRFNQFNLGNIRKKPFSQIIGGNSIIETLKCLNVDNLNEKCKNCEVKYFCGGFCRGETFANTGDLYAPYIRCEDYHEGILEAMWELSENPLIIKGKVEEFLENIK
jgi:radical SAM protein with 4Fe4S-binding SPASM domain